MKFVSTKEAVSSLVGDRPEIQKGHKLLFVTISPNPKGKHGVMVKQVGQRKVKTTGISYGSLPQSKQYDYCIRILERCYFNSLSEGSKIIGTWELNSSGNVHLHMIIYDPLIQNKTQLMIFQRDISMCEQVIKNRKNINDKDYMNNIVFIDKPLAEILKYCDKDYNDNKDIFSNYICE